MQASGGIVGIEAVAARARGDIADSEVNVVTEVRRPGQPRRVDDDTQNDCVGFP